MENSYVIFAKRILQTDSLPDELLRRLNSINNFVGMANMSEEAQLRSSQVTAVVVEQWLRENEEKEQNADSIPY